MKPSLLVNALSLAMLSPLAWADDVSDLREEVARMKQAYEQRIAALEERLAQAEARQLPASPPADNATSTSAAVQGRSVGGAGAPANAFNPETSIILSGTYFQASRDPRHDISGVNGRDRRIQGFLPAGEEALAQQSGFGLGESELAFAANIDPRFRGNLLLSVGADHHVGVEEAHVQALGLGAGTTLKFGRYFSGIGYANEQHPHNWDFVDAALPYQAFFGGRLSYDGLQAKWLAPTATYLELGAETGRAGGFPSTDGNRSKAGAMSGSLFAHTGGDVGDGGSWRGGLSYHATQADNRTYQDVDRTGILVTNGFSGASRTWLADLVWKWAPAGNASQQNLTVQTEWFWRRETGDLIYDIEAASLGTAAGNIRSRQSGGYAQAVWQFQPQWRLGYRYDWLNSGAMRLGLVNAGTRAVADFPLLEAFQPKRHSLMADWRPSEFSTLRLQWTRDDSRPGGADKQWWLQYIVSLGSHGAHRY